MTECITYSGVRLTCRIIGLLQAKQSEKGISVRNDRYFMVPTDSILFEHITEIKDFSKQHNQQLQDFFINHMKAENKKTYYHHLYERFQRSQNLIEITEIESFLEHL